jgi:hypothetical protein
MTTHSINQSICPPEPIYYRYEECIKGRVSKTQHNEQTMLVIVDVPIEKITNPSFSSVVDRSTGLLLLTDGRRNGETDPQLRHTFLRAYLKNINRASEARTASETACSECCMHIHTIVSLSGDSMSTLSCIYR